MGKFTINFGKQTYTFSTNLSKQRAALFSNWGTNLRNSTVTQNSITVNSQEDYNFVLRAFKNLAKADGNANDISDNDFNMISNSSQNCGNPSIKQNIWHSHEPGEYNYHTANPNQKTNPGVKQTIWLSDHSDTGV